jgi:hypothetical protein
MVSQVRDIINMYGTGGQNSIGGNAIKHAKSVEVRLNASTPLMDDGAYVGKTVPWKIVKGKHGLHEGEKGEFIYHFDVGIKIEEDIVDAAISVNLVTRDGPFYTYKGERYKGKITLGRFLIKEVGYESLMQQMLHLRGIYTAQKGQ